MAVFKDHLKRDWTVDIDGPLILAVRSACHGLDLAKGDSYGKLFDDHVLLADVLAILCREQIQAVATLAADKFKSAVRGDAIDSGLAAIKQAQLDFFPSRDRETLELLAAQKEKMREVTLQELQATTAKMDGAAVIAMKELQSFLDDPETDNKIRAAVRDRLNTGLDQATTLLSSATSLPELLESIPESSPSGS